MQMDFLASSVSFDFSAEQVPTCSLSWVDTACGPSLGVPPVGSSLGTKSVPPPLVDTASPSWTGRCTPRDTHGCICEHLSTGAPGPSPPGEQDVGLILEVEVQKGRVVFHGAFLLIAVTARRAGSACSSRSAPAPRLAQGTWGIQARPGRSLPASLGLRLQRGQPGVGGQAAIGGVSREGKGRGGGGPGPQLSLPSPGVQHIQAGGWEDRASLVPAARVPSHLSAGKSCAGGPGGGDDACGARLCLGEGRSTRN